jgi:hypothetical protein
MAKTELTLRVGSSDGVQFRLMEGITGFNLASYGTVELWLRDRAGGTSMTDNLTGKLSINGTAGGSVLWTPGTADLVAGSSPYDFYFRAGRGTVWAYFPEDSELTLNVRPAF